MARELLTAQKWIEAGHTVILAIVARTWGSAPRRAGSLMVVRDDGTFEGSVSGGCVEGAVISESTAILNRSLQIKSKKMVFSVTSEDAWDVGLACGGEIEVRLFPIASDSYSAIEAACTAVKRRNSGVLTFDVSVNSMVFKEMLHPPAKHTPHEEGDSFVTPVIPSLRLYIVGAVHIAQHLAVMAEECGFSVLIIDPRQAFTENRTFGTAKMINAWPDEFFANNKPDVTTAVITLTHDPKLDDAALNTTLNSDAFYIGCLGSRKTHAKRIKRLSELGHTEDILKKINGPVGLNIGAATPAEIAVSVLAQLIETARQTHEI
ncbi:XdhC family protein [Kordiimonas aquimaris]|uniref:XdhC family protein n=1 Tax=Kordiimonas aquimaris TaxID=707591 RepID=UPI0021D0BE00|nr:XdhC family protein [Kordiimonas aquimaris]